MCALFSTRTWGYALVWLSALLCVNPVQAQPDDEAARRIDRILNLEEQRREDERREIQERQRTHTVIPSKSPPEQAMPEDDGTCFEVAEIYVRGVTLLDEQQVATAVEEFHGRCLGVAEINAIISRITNLYIEAGYVTSRAYLPPQSLQSGELQIRVIEGFVEDVRIEGGPARLGRMVFPGAVGNPLNLRTVEQGLDQLNRLTGARATVDFVPGSKVGGTVVVVEYLRPATAMISIGRNNSGQKSTGEQQITASVELNSPLGISDHLYFNVQADTRDDHQGQKSESAFAQYAVPYGYWTFTLGYSQFEYMSEVQGVNTSFLSRGESKTERLSIDRLLYRDQVRKLSANGLIKHQISDNYIEDVKLENSSVDYLSAELGLTYEHYLPGNKNIIGGITYGRKLADMGSETQDEIYADTFQKFNINATYSDSVQWLQGSWRWSSGITAQYADGDLFSGETFSIGSQYTVRGYKEDGLSDSSGAYWRNEVSATYFPLIDNPRFYTTPFVALDAGAVDEGGRLSGWAAGLRLGGENFRGDLTYGRPISAPDPIETEKSVVHFSLSLSIAW